jgi:serine/threonine protein kinase
MNDRDETMERPDRPTIAEAETFPPSESAAEVVRVLDQYMAALQAGHAPDRARLLAEHPELAAQLEPCLASIDFIHHAGSPAGPDGAPTTLGDFRIIREVGRGGMGVVYEAEQVSLRRRVALKVLRFGVVADEEALRRFRIEAETIARLHHTNIVPIFGVGTEREISYYAMQFIEGRSLADVQEESSRSVRPIPCDDVARWGLQAAEALAHAHQRKVIHRDIKPSNLLLDAEGVVWLTDFGLAKRADEVTLTLSGVLMGTPRYMSPEQAEAMKRPIDHRTDLYSLGASLYELATGRPVFESASTNDVIMKVLTADPIAPRAIRPGIPNDLETILLTCLAKEPDRRYPTAQALAEDLRAFLEGRSIRARRTPIWEKAARWAKRQKKSVAIGTIAAVISVVLAGSCLAFWLQHQQSKLGRLSLSTTGEPLIAEVLEPNHDARVVEPFTVPTKSPLALPAGDYRVRLSAPRKVSETYQLRLERGLNQNYDVDLSRRDYGRPNQEQATQDTCRAYPYRVEGRRDLDLIEIDKQSVSRMACGRRPIWSFKPSDQSQIPAGEKLTEWSNLLAPHTNLPVGEMPPGIVRSMPDLDGDGAGDIVVSSRQQPLVFALSGKSGKLLWHWTVKSDGPAGRDTWRACTGEPLVFPGPNGPVIVTTVESGRTGSAGIDVRRAEAIDGLTGRSLWQRIAARHDGCSIPVQRLRIDGKDVVGVESGAEWVGLDPLSGKPSGPGLDFGEIVARRSDNSAFYLLREPCVADLDGDGSDDLLVLRASGNLNGPELLAVSVRHRRLLWTAALDADFTWRDDVLEPDATWPRLADLDADGCPEVLVPYQTAVGPKSLRRFSAGVRALDGRDGRLRWSHRLLTDRDINSARQFVAAPDIDGDGCRDVFVASFWRDDLPHRGNMNPGALYVDALSGRDGRSLWWWSQRIESEDSISRPLRFWENGPDGYPKLVVDIGSNFVRPRDDPTVFIFAASNGRLLHQLADLHPTGSADLDGDGIPELWGTSTWLSSPDTIRPVVVAGLSAERWQRLGRWEVGRDYNRDGVADLVGPASTHHNEVNAISGRDGSILWATKPDLSGATNWGDSGGSPYHFVPLPEKTGDLDGDGVPEIAMTRERRDDAQTNGRLTVGLGVCSGRTGTMLWEGPTVPVESGTISWCAPCNVMAIDAEGRGRADIVALLSRQGSRLDSSGLTVFTDFHIVRFSGESGRLVATSKVAVKSEGLRQYEAYAFEDFASAVIDANGDGRPEIIYELPCRSGAGELTSQFVAASPIDGRVVWSHQGRLPLDARQRSDDVWSRFAAADLDGDSMAEVVLIDVVKGQPRVEQWSLASTSAPQWVWQGDDSDGGALREVSAIPRIVNLDGSGRKAIVVIADQQKVGRRVLVLDVMGRIAGACPIESKRLGHRVWAADLNNDGRDEILFEDRGMLRAARGDLTSELWSSPLVDGIQEIRPREGRGMAVVLGNGVALDGATGQAIYRADRMANFRLINSLDTSRPVAVEILPSQTTASMTRAMTAVAGLTAEPIPAHPDPGDPRIVRALPWVVGSPGGLHEGDRAYLPAIALFAFAAGLYSLTVVVAPICLIGKMLARKAKVIHLLLIPVTVAAACICYLLFRSHVLANLPPMSAATAAVSLAFAGMPILAIVATIGRSLWRNGWRSFAGSAGLWAAGCAIAASLLIYFHQREWMDPSEHYGWEGWWTIWLPGLYVAGSLVIAWKVVSWPIWRISALLRARRAAA